MTSYTTTSMTMEQVEQLIKNERIQQEGNLKDRFACCIVSSCMIRYKEDGYSDESAIKEGYRLADFMLEVRNGRVERN